MGVNRPRLYAAFGDKEALFRKALDRYVNGPVAYTQKALKEPKYSEGGARRIGNSSPILALGPSKEVGFTIFCRMVD
jgi:AcrR family transcriptional regulator